MRNRAGPVDISCFMKQDEYRRMEKQKAANNRVEYVAGRVKFVAADRMALAVVKHRVTLLLLFFLATFSRAWINREELVRIVFQEFLWKRERYSRILRILSFQNVVDLVGSRTLKVTPDRQVCISTGSIGALKTAGYEKVKSSFLVNYINDAPSQLRTLNQHRSGSIAKTRRYVLIGSCDHQSTCKDMLTLNSEPVAFRSNRGRFLYLYF